MQKRLWSGRLMWPLWHLAALISLATLTGLRFGAPPWRLTDHMQRVALIVMAGYIIGAVLVHLLSRGERKATFLEAVTAAVAGYSPIFLYIIVREVQFPRSMLIAGLAATLVLLFLGFTLPRLRLAALVVIGLGVTFVAGFAARSGTAMTAPAAKSTFTQQVATSLYPVQATTSRNFIPRSESYHTGGGMVALAPRNYVAVTSDGALLSVRWTDWNSGPEVAPLPFRVPLNRADFVKAAGRGSYVNYFRAFDVLMHGTGENRQLLVSHHYWNEPDQCFVVRVSGLTWPEGVEPTSLRNPEWDVLYDTEPCLPLIMTEPSWPFRGMEGGGRMALVDEASLLLTVGDQGFNGVDFDQDFVQDRSAAYGKTVRVSLIDGSWRVFSTGHRNAQGLLVDGGRIWSTEHGPQGGDELNALRDGANFGWPLVTYGTDYGRNSWPLSRKQGSHEGFEEPLYAWLPSIGASNLIRVKGGAFDAWRDDLMIGSLVAESVWRVRLADDRISAMEEIHVGERVRDIVEDPSGPIILLTDSYSFVVLQPTRHVYATCAGCHGPPDGSAARLGPSLQNVVGRPVGSHSGYDYSDALRSMEGEWTDQRLDAFLRDPQAFAPGNRMVMPGIEDAETRAEIIRFLKEQR